MLRKFKESLKKYFSKKAFNKIDKMFAEVTVVIGLPGAGKTTMAAMIVSKCLKANKKIYSNVPIAGALPFDVKELGRYDMSNAYIIIDEGGLYYDNRGFKDNFDKASLEYLKLLRHRHNKVILFSQSNDIDVKWQRMSGRFILLKRCLISRKMIIIKRKLGVDPLTHQWTDMFYECTGIEGLLENKKFLPFRYWKMFNSWEAPVLPSFPYRNTY